MKIKNILFLMIVMFAFVSCNDDTDPVLPQYKSSELTHPADDISYVLLQADDSNNLFTLEWKAYKQTELHVGAESYWIQIDTVGNNFARAQSIRQIPELQVEGESHTYSASFTVEEINKSLVGSLGLSPDTLATLEIRVITRIGNAFVESSASNVFKAKFTPYKALDTPVLYIIGDGLIGWDNSVGGIGKDLQVLFGNTNIEVSQGKYTYTGLFKGGAGIKFITKAGDWNTAFGSDASGILTANGGENIPTPATSGFYTLTVDTKALTYSFKPYATGSTAPTYDKIGLIGDGAKGWGDTDDVVMTKYAEHVWVASSVDLKAGGVKFRIIGSNGLGSWDTNWGIDAKINLAPLPFGVSDGGDNVTIEKAGKYYVAFNDLTKHFVFVETSKLP